MARARRTRTWWRWQHDKTAKTTPPPTEVDKGGGGSNVKANGLVKRGNGDENSYVTKGAHNDTIAKSYTSLPVS